MRAWRPSRRIAVRGRMNVLGFAALSLVPIALLVGGVALAVASTASPAAPQKDPQEYQPRPAYAPAAPSTSHVSMPRPTLPAPISPPARGIIQSGQAPFPASSYTFVNQWQAQVGQQWVQVYAGMLTADPSQGVVVVRRSTLDWSASEPPQVLRAPLRSGALQITGAGGTRLSLQSSQGIRYTLDAAGGTLSQAAS
jgi:hypothetical protein